MEDLGTRIIYPYKIGDLGTAISVKDDLKKVITKEEGFNLM